MNNIKSLFLKKFRAIRLNLQSSDRELELNLLNAGSYRLTLKEILTLNILANPETKKQLLAINVPKANTKNLEQDLGIDWALTCGEFIFPVLFNGGGHSPVLYPSKLQKYYDLPIPLELSREPFFQYFLLGEIKNLSEQSNAPINSVPAKRHRFRYKEFTNSLPLANNSILLDIGSDIPSQSSVLYPDDMLFIGLDPKQTVGEFKILGFAELLPFLNESVDAVAFNTSLDHVLDYHLAIEEAWRVLKPNGFIIISTYAWVNRASLLNDNLHFHHFREFEIVGVLKKGFDIVSIKRYEDPKEDTHRYGLYVMGKKKNPSI